MKRVILGAVALLCLASCSYRVYPVDALVDNYKLAMTTPEEVAARMPEGTGACFVRVDQNLIWWVRGEETGAVEIWSDDRL